MSPHAFQDWLVRSILVGGAAGALVLLCPAARRTRIGQVVPVAAFALLLCLAPGFGGPLPGWELRTPEIFTRVVGTAGFFANAAAAWIFAAVAAALLLHEIAAAIAIARLVRRSRPLEDPAWRRLLGECQRALGLRGAVRLRLAGGGFIPSATGLFRRTILLPDEATEWPRSQRRLVLLHELGHFRRGDLWTHALGRITCAIHWFNPFAWMLNRRLALEREFACDALVVSRGAAPENYAELLWKMGMAASGRHLPAAAQLSMAAPGRGKLEQRVRRILRPVGGEGAWRRAADSAVCAGSALLLIACASLKPVVVRAFLAAPPWTPQEISARLSADPFPGEP